MKHTRIFNITGRLLLTALLLAATWTGAWADTVQQTVTFNSNAWGTESKTLDGSETWKRGSVTLSNYYDPNDSYYNSITSNGDLEIDYPGSITLEVPSGCTITGVTFEGSGDQLSASIPTLTSTNSGYTWSGSTSSLTISSGTTGRDYYRYQSITVTYEANLNTLAATTSAGATYTFNQNAEAFADASLDGKAIEVGTQQMYFDGFTATSDPMVLINQTNASTYLHMPEGSRLRVERQSGSSSTYITKVLFTFVSGNPDVTADGGTYTQSTNSWEGSEDAVIFLFNEAADIQVVQTEAAEMYTISLSMQGRGTVKVGDLLLPINDGQGGQTLSGSIKVKAGSDVEFIITPSSDRFYAEQADDNQTDIATQAQTGTYTISSIDANHTVYVRFALKYPGITYMASGNGNISFSATSLDENDQEQTYSYPLSGEIRNLSQNIGIPYGATPVTFTMTADDGYKLSSFLVNSQETLSDVTQNGNVYTYTYPSALTTDIMVQATYVNNTPEAYARLGQTNNGTLLLFRYDTERDPNSTNDFLIENFTSADARGWHDYASDISVVNFMSDFNRFTANLTSTAYWFAGMTALTSIDFSGVDLEHVTNMNGMFQGCSSLETITAASGWPTSITSGTDMFAGCTNLKGGRGTTYDANHTDATYARIDKAPSAPGYLTDYSPEYKLTLTAGANGSVVAEVMSATGATEETYTIAADATERTATVYVPDGCNVKLSMTPVAHYQFSTLTEGDAQVTTGFTTEGNATVYTFTGISNNFNANVAFALASYEITLSAGPNGSISYTINDDQTTHTISAEMSEQVSVDYTTKLHLTFVPSTEYNFGSLIKDGSENVSVTGNTITLENFESNAIYAAAFVEKNAEAYARYNQDSHTLTFYYDKGKTDTDFTVSTYNVGGERGWNSVAGDITSVTFTDSFSGYAPTSMAWWFSGMSSLTTLNLSSLNVSNLSDISSMFTGSTSLQTITVSSSWPAQTSGGASGVSGSDVFTGCAALVGGRGTTYNDNNTDATYARIDKAPTTPGYFTGTDTEYKMTLAAGANGSVVAEVMDVTGTTADTYTISADATERTVTIYVPQGNSVKLTMTPAANYSFSSLTQDETVITEGITDGDNNAKIYSFRSLSANSAVNVQFALTQYYITLTAGANGNINYKLDDAAAVTVAAETTERVAVDNTSTLALTFVPAEGYQFEKLTKDGTEVTVEGDTYTIKGVNADASYVATFVELTPEAYAALSDNNTVLTFYYDDQVDNRGGMSVESHGWNLYSGAVTLVKFDSSFANYSPTSTAYWFYEMSALTSIEGIDLLSTVNVTDMQYMFFNCSSLTTLEVSGFKTENVTNMYRMFYGCSGLTTLDVSKFTTDLVTDMNGMFALCSKLTTLNLSSFNTSKVTNMNSMFSDCSSLTTIIVGDGWTLGSLQSGSGLFDNCTNLKGGAGTTYNSRHTDSSYAHIDGGESNPGYFTAESATGNFEVYAIAKDATITPNQPITATQSVTMTPGNESAWSAGTMGPTTEPDVVLDLSKYYNTTGSYTFGGSIKGTNTPRDGELTTDQSTGEVTSSGNQFIPPYKNLPKSGAYVVYQASQAGSFIIPLRVVADKSFFVVDSKGNVVTDIQLKDEQGNTVALRATPLCSVSDTFTGFVSFNATKDEQYYIFVTGSGATRYGGYAFSPESITIDPTTMAAVLDELIPATVADMEIFAVDATTEVKSNTAIAATRSVTMTPGNDTGWDNGLLVGSKNAIKFVASKYYPSSTSTYTFWGCTRGQNSAKDGELADTGSTGSSYDYKSKNAPRSGEYMSFEASQNGSLILPMSVPVNKPLYVIDGEGKAMTDIQFIDTLNAAVPMLADPLCVFSTEKAIPGFLSFNVKQGEKYTIFINGGKDLRYGGYIFNNETIDIDPTTMAAVKDILDPKEDITVQPATGVDIAEAVNRAMEGKRVGKVTVELESNGNYTINSTVTVPGSLTFLGNGATINASALEAPFIALSANPTASFQPKNDGSGDTDYYGVEMVSIKDVKVTGLKNSIFYDNNVKYVVLDFKVENSVFQLATEVLKNDALIAFQAGGAKDFTVKSSTIYGNMDIAKYFLRYNNAARIDRYGFVNEDDTWSFTYENNTFYGLLVRDGGQWGNYNGITGRKAQGIITVKNNIWVDCDVQTMRRLLNSQTFNSGFHSSSTMANNLFNRDGVVVDQGTYGNGTDVNGVITFTDAANGNFNGEVQLIQGTAPETTLGDPSWTVTFLQSVSEPYAILENNVLTFYYDDQKSARNGMSVGPFSIPGDRGWESAAASVTTVVFDQSMANCTSLTSTAYWFYGFQALTTITDIGYLKTDNVTDMQYMFYDCNLLPNIELTGFNTANVTNMRGLFYKCHQLQTIDLSSFNTAKVTDVSWMFYGCSAVTTIYAGSSWALPENVTDEDGAMFNNCTNLKGGAGTPYDANHVDHTYAHIDGGTSNPGYFTDKNAATDIIEFADANVKAICVSKWDTNGDGELSKDEAAAVTTLDRIFKDNQTIGSFNELKYFTGLQELLSSEFEGSSVTSLELPYGLKRIGDEAFDVCRQLESILIPATVSSMGSDTGFADFWECSNLKAITVDENNNYYASVDNVLFNKEKTKLIRYAPAKRDEEYEIPSTVTEINQNAFNVCSNLISLSIPASVIKMGYGAFQGCTALRQVNIAEGVTMIASAAFRSCDSLERIHIPASVTQIGDEGNSPKNVFFWSNSLIEISVDENNPYFMSEKGILYSKDKSVIAAYPAALDGAEFAVPSGVTKIADCCFTGTTKLTAILIPETVVSYGQAAINISDATLQKLTVLTTTPPKIEDNTFSDAVYSATLYVPKGTTQAYADSIGWKKFQNIVEIETAPSIDSNGTMTVEGDMTMAQAVETAGGSTAVNEKITSIVWNSSVVLTDQDLNGFGNPNMLVFVEDATKYSGNRNNVVVVDEAEQIVLTDTVGNNNFYCPKQFTAKRISYTHNYKQTTQVGVSRGWETIALPFAVQTITHEKNGTLVPFGMDGGKPFWLVQLTENGLKSAQRMEAYVPYLISMPNNVIYPSDYNQAGYVTFSATNAVVNVTEQKGTSGNNRMLIPAYQRVEQSPSVYAINRNASYEGNPEGSIFVANYREVRPFEAYVEHPNGGARYFTLNDLSEGDVTGLQAIRNIAATDLVKVYNLSGVLVKSGKRHEVIPHLTKGVYIINGSKVVIK